MSRELLTANHAAAMAAVLAGRANRAARGFGSGIYPITPQSESIELLCQLPIEKGHVVRVESEHSAMAVCTGFAWGGARTFTASSANGLAYMIENVYVAAFSRLPVVMMAVNRTLGPPWNIWADHGDTLMLRDTGWIQFYCEDNQEVFDTVLLAFRLAEDHRVLLPVLVCLDAFVLSHTMMLIDLPEQEAVDAFLPLLQLPHRLTDRPRVVGGLDCPHEVEVHRRQLVEAMARVPAVYAEVQQAFATRFGRRPDDALVAYRLDDAELVLVSMGTTAATARQAVDEARARGVRAGSVRVRMFRPLPLGPLAALLGPARRVAVIDRDISPGLGGVLWGELRGGLGADRLVQGYVVGLGGGDIRPQHLGRILDDLASRERAGEPALVEVGA
ncbi:MAG: pyruvate ferredoxin oxidoreductase [Deltaproteobacteria bacterium]|nr:pyruvate ferredoxin oxidoreductase [Deltaproteobacteria bacterium]